MNKKLKGFSLAELLISLLIISIVLSAAIPTLTRKSGANREYIWKWSVNNNSAYFGVGANQSAIIGFDRHPINDQQALGSIINDSTDLNDADSTSEATYKRKDIGVANLTEVPFSIYGDKLVLLKKPVLADNNGNESNFTNSHISFFTAKNSKVATTDDIKYAGRLALDPGNIALGIGSLQNQKLDSDNANAIGENTAIGHFSLLRNTTGIRNTAIGKKTLTANEEGGYNTAVGFGSLFELGSAKLTGTVMTDQGFENTAVGALSQQYNNVGKQNTSLGAQSLRHLVFINGSSSIDKYGNNGNTALGWASMFNLTEGQSNTAIGAGACRNILRGNNNICIGTGSGYNQNSEFAEEDNYGVYIGSATSDSAPLISGHSKKSEAKLSTGSSSKNVTFDQELIINAKNVAFRPYNGSNDIFKFESYQGKDGYGGGASQNEQSIRFGYAYFNLRDTVSGDTAKTDKTSVTLKFSADDKGDNKKTAYIEAFDDAHKFKTEDALSDISFNKMLSFSFPIDCDFSTSEYCKVLINAGDETKTNKYPLYLNEKIIVKNEDLAPKLWIQSGKLLVNSQDDKTKIEIKVPGKNESGSPINSATSDITIQQNEATNKFMIFQGSQADSSPRIQLDKGVFFVQDVDEAHIVSKKGSEIKAEGGMYIEGGIGSKLKFTGSGSDVCAEKGCINQMAEEIQRLQGMSASDIRLKNVSGDNSAGLKEINALEVKNYTYKNDKEKTPHVGVIAQQLQKIFPAAVTKDDKGYLRIRTEDIFYAMVNSIKDLFKQLQDLTAKVTGLDKRITELEKQNKLLTEQNKAFEKRLQKLERQSAKTK